ncbi:hypothetical protein BHU72_15060 [Desulfuribacillus stibiiarsenatis]|uniref:Tyr recombinase domain-containing protein n=1 Tax=Desulfuribacillus stibiiarsenatis TaxID=1390249 RepID=A0A1E5L6D6_9FIRM|nr:HNH endonuclease [Desulfuribacillus stibiiarsenatis]OEH85559.1 hypothetical protein BHU72_15060 [Desulfuribacillus stibiiarsenatis]
MNILADQLLEEYLASDLKSVRTHSRKLTDYYLEFEPVTLEDCFDEETMKLFIFARETSPKNVRAALSALYEFAKGKGYINRLELFPILEEETSGLNTKGRKGETSFIPRKYSLMNLYANDIPLYNDIEKKLVVRAYIALCLGAGYRPVDVENMKLSDYNRETNAVINPYKVMEKTNNISVSVVDYIKLIPPASTCIEEFWDYFWSNKQMEDKEAEKFIFSVSKTKPVPQVRIALKQMTKNMGLKMELAPRDLRANMLLHSLYNSNGASLPDLIRIFGNNSITLVNALENYYKGTEMNMIQSYDPAIENAEEDEESESKKKDYIIERIIRDTKKAILLKRLYNNTCQICGESIKVNYNKNYSECHHIKPLGKPHNGSDTWDNMLILCPNHHAMFDLGCIAIHPETGEVFQSENDTYTKIQNKIHIIEKEHKLNPKYIKYHWEIRFLPNIYPIKSSLSTQYYIV